MDEFLTRETKWEEKTLMMQIYSHVKFCERVLKGGLFLCGDLKSAAEDRPVKTTRHLPRPPFRYDRNIDKWEDI